ncbi:MAG: hypothetical protein RL653_74 [Pseudomonadota bacterium]|jgi:hypothetical protein
MPRAILLASLCAFALVGSAAAQGRASGTSPVAPPGGDLSDGDVKALASQLGCPSKARAFYCGALDRFARGKVPSVTGTRKSHLGTAFFVSAGREHATYLLLDDDGASFDAVTPENAREAADMKRALDLIRAGKQVPASNPLQKLVTSLAEMPIARALPTRTLGRSRTLSRAGTRLLIRQEGDAYVVLQVSLSPLGLNAVGVNPGVARR